MSKQVQDTQIRSSFAYSDAQPAGAGMETPVTADRHLEWDLNNLRSQFQRIIDAGGGAKWSQDLAAAGFDSFTLRAIHDKPFVYPAPITYGTNDFTLAGAVQGVLVAATLVAGGAGTIAVGPSSTKNGGYVAQPGAAFTVAGTLGVGLEAAVDGDGVLISDVRIIDAATNDPVLDGGATVFGLLQCVTGTADGTAIAASPSQNLQISFVKLEPGADALTAVTLPIGSYHFGLSRQRDFFSLSRGALGKGTGGEVIDPGQTIPIPGFRVIDISGPGPGNQGPAANDPMTVLTGTFATGGAQTVFATNGTPALPASGALFRDDPRIQVLRNGKEEDKGAAIGDGRDCYWISATQLAFKNKLKIGEVITIRSPEAF